LPVPAQHDPWVLGGLYRAGKVELDVPLTRG
jgi:hypothetical protein